MGDGKGIIPTARTSRGSPRRSKKRNQVDQLVTLGKIQKAVELRKKGATYLRIGSELECSTTYAFKLVRRGIVTLAGEAGEDAKTVKALIVARMDSMMLMLWTMLDSKKDPPDTPTVLSIIGCIGRIDDRRAKLEGLIGGPAPAVPLQVPIDLRTQAAAERMAPILQGCTLDERREMLRLMQAGQARVAGEKACYAQAEPPVTFIPGKTAVQQHAAPRLDD